ncbi:hypothetical protein C8T65DRAFT_785657 [Cerioporus squamosus]|nr:hypothetical protein C8T65DRAFT_785657 [Cerioporus squamosus]
MGIMEDAEDRPPAKDARKDIGHLCKFANPAAGTLAAYHILTVHIDVLGTEPAIGPRDVVKREQLPRKAVVVGAGPVGCLAAISLAKMGWSGGHLRGADQGHQQSQPYDRDGQHKVVAVDFRPQDDAMRDVEGGKDVNVSFDFWYRRGWELLDHPASADESRPSFAPTAEFDRLNSDEAILRWFQTNFPTRLPLIGQEALLADFPSEPPQCAYVNQGSQLRARRRPGTGHPPSRCRGRPPETIQTPDGQEDPRLARALSTYSANSPRGPGRSMRTGNGQLRRNEASVTTLGYRFRKALDNLLYSSNRNHVTAKDVTAPSGQDLRQLSQRLAPAVHMVTFRPDISYSTAQRKFQRQSRILETTAWLSAGVVVGTAGITCVTLLRRLYARA